MKSNRMIPFSRPCITDQERKAVDDVLTSGWLTTGPRTKEFEAAFSRYLGVSEALAVNSCTAALHLALVASGIQEGDEVLVPSMTFAASAEVVYYCGARPVLTDVDPKTHNVRVADLEAALTPKTKAVIIVHFSGVSCEVTAIARWCRERGLKLIEDCAHAIETTYQGKHVGTFGDFGCYSFYANKNLATGEGGMLICQDPSAMEKARIMSLHGMSKDAWKRFTVGGSWRYDIVAAGFKYNLTDMASAMGLVQLSRVEEMAACRAAIVDRYLKGLHGISGVDFQQKPEESVNAHHLFIIRIMPPGKPGGAKLHRDQVYDELKKRGIMCAVHYTPLHRMSFYAQQGYDPAKFLVADWLGESSLSLPLYPDLAVEDQNFIISSIREILAE